MKPFSQALLKTLQDICPGNVRVDVSMAEISSWRVGGNVAAFVTPSSMQQLIEVRKFFLTQQIPSLVIGNTTNLLFTDDYINAAVIQISSSFSNINIEGEAITAQAGVWVPALARKAMQFGLTGLEHVCGIPGTIGGLVVMNGGSQRKCIGENIAYVKTVDKKGQIKFYSNEQCKFSYRRTIFQELDDVIVEVGLKLTQAEDKFSVHSEMLSILGQRSKKFPRKLPSCGSVFVSNPAMYEKLGPPGKVIEDFGLKGFAYGRAQVSPIHANFIVNNGGASAKDILHIIQEIKAFVLEKTGYLMEVEAKYVTAAGCIQEL